MDKRIDVRLNINILTFLNECHFFMLIFFSEVFLLSSVAESIYKIYKMVVTNICDHSYEKKKIILIDQIKEKMSYCYISIFSNSMFIISAFLYNRIVELIKIKISLWNVVNNGKF